MDKDNKRQDRELRKLRNANRRLNGRISANQNNGGFYRKRTEGEINFIWGCIALILITLAFMVYGYVP